MLENDEKNGLIIVIICAIASFIIFNYLIENKNEIKWNCEFISMNGTHYERCINKNEVCIIKGKQLSCFKNGNKENEN